jgi:RNA polymerase-binding transcription factor DksA
MTAGHDEIRRSLLDRRAVLTAQVDGLETDRRQPLDDDFAEQAVVRENDETLDAVEQGALAEIAGIEAALVRLDQGSYGVCRSCGKPIPAARLAAIPAAVQCVACAGATVAG